MMSRRWKSTVPVVLQDEEHECILACLAMVVGAHGGRASLDHLRRRFSGLGRGGSLRDLITIARHLGLGARAVKAPPEAIGKLRLPCVLHWNFAHFVVLERVGRRSITVVDPVCGRIRLDRPAFAAHYTGVAVELPALPSFKEAAQDPAETPDRDDTRREEATPLATRLYAGPIARVAALSTITLLFGLLPPLAVQVTVDEVIVKGDADLLIVVIALFLAANLAATVLGYLQGAQALRLAGTTRLGMTFEYLTRLFQHDWPHFARRPLGSFVAQQASLNQVVTVYIGSAGRFIGNVALVAVVVVILLAIDALTAAIACATTTGVLVMRAALLRRSRRLQDRAIGTAADEEAYFVETMRGMGSVKANGLELPRVTGGIERTLGAVNAQVGAQLFTLRFNAVVSAVKAADVAIILFLLASNVMAGTMTIGVMYAFYSYRQFLDGRVNELLAGFGELLDVRVHLDRTEPVLRRPTGVSSVVAGALRARGELTFERVSHSIDNGRRVLLNDLDLTIAPGTFVAVVGPTGAGKTTLLRLALGLVEPEAGSVLLDGSALDARTLPTVRASTGTVLQEDTLFRGTVADNVAHFSTSIDLSRVAQCLRTAGVIEEVEAMPLGLFTDVGDMGSNMSTGQRQRVLLARALYQRPSILVLDEATANLNADMEKSVIENLRSLKITILFASHSSHVMNAADRVIRIEGGAVHNLRSTTDREPVVP